MTARAGRQLQVDGLDALRDMLKNVGKREANNAMRAATQGLAVMVRDMLKKRVKKDSRDLERSLIAVRRRGRPGEHVSEVRGGSRAPYMLMLEFGTSRTRAQPFIVPTTEEIRPKQAQYYREQFFEKLAKGLEREARRKGRAA